MQLLDLCECRDRKHHHRGCGYRRDRQSRLSISLQLSTEFANRRPPSASSGRATAHPYCRNQPHRAGSQASSTASSALPRACDMHKSWGHCRPDRMGRSRRNTASRTVPVTMPPLPLMSLHPRRMMPQTRRRVPLSDTDAFTTVSRIAHIMDNRSHKSEKVGEARNPQRSGSLVGNSGVRCIDAVPPTIHHHHPVRHRQSLILIVGDHDRGYAEAALRSGEFRCGLLPWACGHSASGSSSSRISGLNAMARANAARCCYPPESSCGRRPRNFELHPRQVPR